jgi:hypothetical protein
MTTHRDCRITYLLLWLRHHAALANNFPAQRPLLLG